MPSKMEPKHIPVTYSVFALILTVAFLRAIVFLVSTPFSPVSLISVLTGMLALITMWATTVLAWQKSSLSPASTQRPIQTYSEWKKEWIAEQYNEQAVWESRFTGQSPKGEYSAYYEQR